MLVHLLGKMFDHLLPLFTPALLILLSGGLIIQVPEDTYSVNSSFLEGLLGDAIKKLGKRDFHEKFKVTGNYTEELNEAIYNALRDANA